MISDHCSQIITLNYQIEINIFERGKLIVGLVKVGNIFNQKYLNVCKENVGKGINFPIGEGLGNRKCFSLEVNWGWNL